MSTHHTQFVHNSGQPHLLVDVLDTTDNTVKFKFVGLRRICTLDTSTFNAWFKPAFDVKTKRNPSNSKLIQLKISTDKTKEIILVSRFRGSKWHVLSFNDNGTVTARCISSSPVRSRLGQTTTMRALSMRQNYDIIECEMTDVLAIINASTNNIPK